MYNVRQDEQIESFQLFCFINFSLGSGHAIKIKGDTQGLSRFISLGCHKFGGTVIYLLFLFYFDTEGVSQVGR